MHKENLDSFIDQKTWSDSFGQLKEEQSSPIEQFSLFQDSSIVNNNSNNSTSSLITSCENDKSKDFTDLISRHGCIDKQMFKRSRPSTLMEEDLSLYFSSNSHSPNENDYQQDDSKSGNKKQKQSKQCVYSKNYRDKKKQQFKILEEQNSFLKKKIQDLQIRLRQIQMQNSRLKQLPKQKELSIQEFNKQFMEKISFISQKIQDNIAQTKEKQRIQDQAKLTLQRQFIQGYELHGFSGSRKKQVLEYHMNEILQVVLRDSEKYLCMLCCKNKDDSFKVQMPEYQKINTAFFEIMELNEQERQRVKTYVSFLFPAMKQIKKQCSDMYRNFSKIIKSMDRVHNLLKTSYIKNIDFVIKRMKLQSWFAYHKYHKMIRKLKDQWKQFVKCQEQNQSQYSQKHRRGYKRNKIQQNLMID